MAGNYSSTGCTILLWVADDSWRLEGLDEDSRDAKAKELLEDAVILLSGRWSMDSSYLESNGKLYAHLVCPRFTIGPATIIRALGNLGGTVHVHRGGPADSAKQLVRYIECKRKYEVPDVVSGDSSGDVDQGSSYQNYWAKKTKK